MSLPAKAKYTREIGRGSHGIVYRATWNNQTVAIKCIPKRTHKDTQWKREVEMMQSLSNIHGLPRLLAAEETRDSYCIVMSHIQGTDGSTVLSDVRHGGYVYEETLRVWLKDLVHILQEIHRREIVYNDLKPNNMLVAFDQAFLVDVGSCRKHTLRKGKPIGSPYYFAPEKFEGYNLYESDVWSLGVTIHSLVCGYHPYAFPYVETPKDLLTMIMNTPLAFQREPWSKRSDDLKDLLQRMLEKDPANRIYLDDILEHPWLQ